MAIAASGQIQAPRSFGVILTVDDLGDLVFLDGAIGFVDAYSDREPQRQREHGEVPHVDRHHEAREADHTLPDRPTVGEPPDDRSGRV